MNLYLITQNVNTGYDTTDSIVVAAESEQDAATVKPVGTENYCGSWVGSISDLKITLIGVAIDGIEQGIIIESFNAG